MAVLRWQVLCGRVGIDLPQPYDIVNTNLPVLGRCP